MLKISSIITKLYAAMKQNTVESSYQLIAFGIFGTIAYPLYYLLNRHLSGAFYDNLPLRIIASVMCFLLVLNKMWPKFARALLPFYWYLTLLYGIPFFFTFMLFKNNLSTPWLMNTITVLFLLMLLTEWISFFVLLVFGIFIGWLAYDLTTLKPISLAHRTITHFDVIGTYTVSIIMGLIFLHNRNQALKEKYQLLKTVQILKEKHQLLKTLAGNIAHDLRTPLASISFTATFLKKYLAMLVKSYKSAKEAELIEKEIPRGDLPDIETSADNIMHQTRFSNTFIDMMLNNLKGEEELKHTSNKKCDISEVVSEYFHRYPFSIGERELVHWEKKNNFEFIGSKLMMINVLNNLTSNAIYAIKEVSKGEIFIWFEKTERYNKLHFKDTAKGAPPEIAERLFESFFTRKSCGTGLGLASCKRILTSINGDIKVRSKEREYMEFILEFPHIRK